MEERTNRSSSAEPRGDAVHRAFIYAGIVVLALLLWQIVDAILLIFMGILLAVFFRGLATRLSAHTPLPLRLSLLVVAVVLAVVLIGAWTLLGPRVSQQFAQLSETLPQSVDQLRQSLEESRWGEYILGRLETSGGRPRLGGDLFSRLTGMASQTLTVLTNLFLVLFAAIFFAIDPDLYKRGVVLLVPGRMADRVRETLDVSGRALWKWLMGKLIAMVFVGVVVTIGLLLVGVPLALVLGILAGLMDFVPFIGPIVAAIPGILLAFTIGPLQAFYAGLVYLIAQQIEGNVVTPLIQQKEVSLPPVLVLFAVIAAGLLFGLLGVIVATPLVVVIMVVVKMLYVEDALGKSVSVPGRYADSH